MNLKKHSAEGKMKEYNEHQLSVFKEFDFLQDKGSVLHFT